MAVTRETGFFEYCYNRFYPFAIVAIFFITGLPGMLLGILKNPRALGSKSELHTLFFGSAWALFCSPFLDMKHAPHKRPLLEQAHGIVLHVGPGAGDDIKYYRREKITKLILVEPNHVLFPEIRRNAREAGFAEDQYIICGCGVEEEERVFATAGFGAGDIDTVVTMLCLCAVPNPRKIIAALYNYLKPGGIYVFYEHVRSHEASTARYQKVITAFYWDFFFGCELARPSDKWILEGFEWASRDYQYGTPGMGLHDPFPSGHGRVQKPLLKQA